MELFGLTGGIASGKSTVTALFRAKGVPVIDADVVAREVVAPGEPALQEIAARWPHVIAADGTLDRAKLGGIVFSSPTERATLDRIVHPRVREAVLRATAQLESRGEPLALYDAPLLIENRLHEGLAGVILVTVPPEVQLARLMARNTLSEPDAKARIASQMPLEAKRPFATWVIDNGGSREATATQVERVWEALRARPMLRRA